MDRFSCCFNAGSIFTYFDKNFVNSFAVTHDPIFSNFSPLCRISWPLSDHGPQPGFRPIAGARPRQPGGQDDQQQAAGQEERAEEGEGQDRSQREEVPGEEGGGGEEEEDREEVGAGEVERGEECGR